MRQLALVFCIFFVFLTENVQSAKNDTLEMELESNITVVKLEHGLKFQAHSEFGLPDNMTDLFNSTGADSEGSNNSTAPVSLEHPRARRSNKDGERAEAKKPTPKVTKKVTSTTKKVTKKGTTKRKGTTKKVKPTTKKPKVTTKKKTTKKQTTKKLTPTTPIPPHQRPPATQHKVPDQVLGKLIDYWNEWFQYISQKTSADKRPPATVPRPMYPWTQAPRPVPETTTRRVFVMYEDEELEKKKPKRKEIKEIDHENFDFESRSS